MPLTPTPLPSPRGERGRGEGCVCLRLGRGTDSPPPLPDAGGGLCTPLGKHFQIHSRPCPASFKFAAQACFPARFQVQLDKNLGVNAAAHIKTSTPACAFRELGSNFLPVIPSQTRTG